MMFGRRKKQGDDARAEESEESTPEGDADTAAAPEETSTAKGDGPHDHVDVTDLGNRVDLGALHVAPPKGMEMRLEVDQHSGDVTAVQIGNDDGSVQLQAFAAPRSAGVWEDIRDEISEMISSGGGTVDEATGPFGTELRTRLAQPGSQGRTVFAPAVFAGVDGPRWFLRAVYSGSAAIDDEHRAPFDEVIRSTVVHRGDEPRAPREMLPLTMPEAAQRAAGDSEDESRDDLKPFERGPEITEVR